MEILTADQIKKKFIKTDYDTAKNILLSLKDINDKYLIAQENFNKLSKKKNRE